MNLDCSPGFRKIGKLVNKMVERDGKASSILGDATLQIGPASEAHFGVPLSAVQNPIYVGDGAAVGKPLGFTPELDALYKKSALNIDVRPRFNVRTGKYDMQFLKSGVQTYTGDSGELIAAQAISPWNASYFPELFKQPLLYSHARDLVKRMGGTKPWAQVQNLAMAAYSGWSLTAGAGTVASNLKQNVNVQGGIMSSAVINIKVFYNFNIEEIERAKDGDDSPFGGELMKLKPLYAQYIVDMTTDLLTYYGNDETNTLGLFDVNGETTWDGPTLEEIANDPSIKNKGYAMYMALCKPITKMLDNSQNKFDIIHVAMSPKAFNYLTSVPYSEEFEAKSALTIFDENFNAGVTKNGSKPNIKFFADPLLSANTEFNSSDSDKLVITAPEIGAGPNDEKQDLILAGIPLENFTYPVNPNGYDQQHCTLRRYAGIFCPVSIAVECYSGFGTTKRTVATPVADPAAGTFSGSTNVKLTTTTAGASIFYTVDGSAPTAESTAYTSAGIDLSATTTIKAIAIKDGMYDSAVFSGTYTKS